MTYTKIFYGIFVEKMAAIDAVGGDRICIRMRGRRPMKSGTRQMAPERQELTGKD